MNVDGVSSFLYFYHNSFVDPDGKTHTVTYIAGAGIGFQPTGDDIHPEVSAAVELNLKNPPEKTEEEKKKLAHLSA